MPFTHHLWVLTDHTCTRRTDPGQGFLGLSCSTPAWRTEAGRSGMCSEDKSAIGQPPKAQVLSLSPSFPSSPPIPLHGLKPPPPLLQPLKDLLIHSIQNLCSFAFRGPSRPPDFFLAPSSPHLWPSKSLSLPTSPASLPLSGCLTILPRFSSFSPHQQNLLRRPSPQIP